MTTPDVPRDHEQTADTAPPLVTVTISTRDRGNSITRLIRSILANDYPRFEVIVADQSKNDLTETQLQPFRSNPRLRYIRTPTEGVSAGRNMAIDNACSEYIALIDDDCEAPTSWLRQLVAAFGLDPRIGVVFGNVRSGPHDRSAGFIPIYLRTEPYLARSMRDKHQVEGISACMGVRRSLWETLCGFDEMLGAGAPLKSGAESDFTIRALLGGAFVYETPAVSVIHHGFRTWEQGRMLIHRYWYGTGAMMAKHLKCGHWSIVPLLLRLAWRWAFGRSGVATSLGDRPHRFLRLASFLRGVAAGAVFPVDRGRGHFEGRRPGSGSGFGLW